MITTPIIALTGSRFYRNIEQICRMKVIPVSSLVTFLILLVSCRGGENVKARIFERREIRNDKLMIKYRYVINRQSYIDSATIENRVISGDSIDVTIDPSNPGESAPQF
jgi:hypothetical protein